jgi:hypothetical protein
MVQHSYTLFFPAQASILNAVLFCPSSGDKQDDHYSKTSA